MLMLCHWGTRTVVAVFVVRRLFVVADDVITRVIRMRNCTADILTVTVVAGRPLGSIVR